jgi:hypothetical protein
MHIENDRPVGAVGPLDLRDALLALSLIPPALCFRYSVRAVEASAKVVSGLIDASPLRSPVRQLEELWNDQLAEVEIAARDSLELGVAWFLEHFDPISMILDRVNIDEIVAERVDVEAVINRVDVVAIAREVIFELDLPEIVRDSSQSMAAETVDGLRRRGMNADRSLAVFVDRVLRRKRGDSASMDPSPDLGQPT